MTLSTPLPFLAIINQMPGEVSWLAASQARNADADANGSFSSTGRAMTISVTTSTFTVLSPSTYLRWRRGAVDRLPAEAEHEPFVR